MPWLIFALGLGLAVAGGASVVHGYPYMQLEFGWTEVIAGATAISGGIVTFALGAVLSSLSTLRKSLASTKALPVLLNEGSNSHLHLAEPRSELQPPVLPPVPPAPVAAEPKKPVDLPGRAKTEKPKILRLRPTLEPLARERARPETPVPVPVAAAPADASPAIMGRYESGGSAYVLFSDGTIEVTSDTGTRKFASMDELKAFVVKDPPETLREEAKG